MKLLLRQNMFPKGSCVRLFLDIAADQPVHVCCFVLPQSVQILLNGLWCQNFSFFHNRFSIFFFHFFRMCLKQR